MESNATLDFEFANRRLDITARLQMGRASLASGPLVDDKRR
jgi:hypothetical protein